MHIVIFFNILACRDILTASHVYNIRTDLNTSIYT